MASSITPPISEVLTPALTNPIASSSADSAALTSFGYQKGQRLLQYRQYIHRYGPRYQVLQYLFQILIYHLNMGWNEQPRHFVRCLPGTQAPHLFHGSCP